MCLILYKVIEEFLYRFLYFKNMIKVLYIENIEKNNIKII